MQHILVLLVGVLLAPVLARADTALIQVSPCAIMQTNTGSQPVPFVNIPGKWQAYNVPPGWVSPDGTYQLVTVPPFVVPGGKIISGSPAYAADAQCNVTVTYPTIPAPVPPPAPATCTGPPTFLFAVSNGVVTHC